MPADSSTPVLDAGRGQPNWLATTPRAAFFELGSFAVADAAAASTNPLWGTAPNGAGIAERLAAHLRASGSAGAAFLTEAVAYGVDQLGFDPDAWVLELVRGILGAGYPSPTRMLTHLEQVLERYVVAVHGCATPPGTFHVFGTEGGAAAMADVFRTLQENQLIRRGDAIAITTPIFTPYLQIPVLQDFGFDVVEIRAAMHSDHRFDDGMLDALADPRIKAFIVVNPGNPDSRAIRPERLRELAELVVQRRPDLVVITDTVYATFVEGFRGLVAEVPRNVIVLHSFSKNFGATGNRLGFVAMAREHVVDELLAAQPYDVREALAARYRSMTSDVATLPFISRLVADTREVALFNIAGLATPDQVQMALFALAYLVPSQAPYAAGTRAELGRRLDALVTALGIPAPGGQDSTYYALVDLLQVAATHHGREAAARLRDHTDPTDVTVRLSRDHGVVVLPGQKFGAGDWDVRISLASLTVDDLRVVGTAIVAVLGTLIDGA